MLIAEVSSMHELHKDGDHLSGTVTITAVLS